jgi:hypothetical protein
MGCGGEFTGTYYQLIDRDGKAVREAIESTDSYVADDTGCMGDGRICWPYVEMEWSLSKPGGFGGVEGKNPVSMCLACVSLGKMIS